MMQKKSCTWICNVSLDFWGCIGSAGFLPSTVRWFMHDDSSSMGSCKVMKQLHYRWVKHHERALSVGEFHMVLLIV